MNRPRGLTRHGGQFNELRRDKLSNISLSFNPQYCCMRSFVLTIELKDSVCSTVPKQLSVLRDERFLSVLERALAVGMGFLNVVQHQWINISCIFIYLKKKQKKNIHNISVLCFVISLFIFISPSFLPCYLSFCLCFSFFFSLSSYSASIFSSSVYPSVCLFVSACVSLSSLSLSPPPPPPPPPPPFFFLSLTTPFLIFSYFKNLQCTLNKYIFNNILLLPY